MPQPASPTLLVGFHTQMQDHRSITRTFRGDARDCPVAVCKSIPWPTTIFSEVTPQSSRRCHLRLVMQNTWCNASAVDLVRPQVVSCDFVVILFAQVSTRRSDHGHAVEFRRVQTGVHQAGVGQRTDVKQISVNIAQRLRQSGNAEGRRPILCLPSPVGISPSRRVARRAARYSKSETGAPPRRRRKLLPRGTSALRHQKLPGRWPLW